MARLITVSESLKRKIISEGRTGAPIITIPNGVDLVGDASKRIGKVRSSLNIPEEAPLIGIIARLEPEKGHQYFIGAAAEVLKVKPAARFLIVGEGSCYSHLRDQVKRLGLSESVIFTGQRDDVPELVTALDVVVLSSVREAQGLSLLEAMALAKPVVATRVGGIPEVVQHGESGLLVPPADSAALAGAILELLDDPARSALMGRRGQELVKEKFPLGQMISQIEAIYDELAEGSASSSLPAAATG